MGWLAAAAAAVGGLLFWRRKTLNEDVDKAKGAAMDAVAKVKNRGGEAAEGAEADTAEPEAPADDPADDAAADDGGDASESDDS